MTRWTVEFIDESQRHVNPAGKGRQSVTADYHAARRVPRMAEGLFLASIGPAHVYVLLTGQARPLFLFHRLVPMRHPDITPGFLKSAPLKRPMEMNIVTMPLPESTQLNRTPNCTMARHRSLRSCIIFTRLSTILTEELSTEETRMVAWNASDIGTAFLG
jgi:hypothetical protein